MGLDCSHNAFHGSYGAFNRFRKGIAKVTGGSFPPHEDKSLDNSQWYFDDEITGPEKTPGIWCLMQHSDCDGEISPSDCLLVAQELLELLPRLEILGKEEGHILDRGGYHQVAKRFAEGCMAAHHAGEPLIFG